MPRKSFFAMTDADHLAVGSTPPAIQKINPGVALHDLLTEAEIRARVMEEIALCTLSYQQILANPEKQMFHLHMNHYVVPNITFLRSVGKLPEELKDFDPEKAFPLPQPSECYTMTGRKERFTMYAYCDGGYSWSHRKRDDPRDHILSAKGITACMTFIEQMGIGGIEIRGVQIGAPLSIEEFRELRRSVKEASKK